MKDSPEFINKFLLFISLVFPFFQKGNKNRLIMSINGIKIVYNGITNCELTKDKNHTVRILLLFISFTKTKYVE